MQTCRTLQEEESIGVAAIMSNDVAQYPQDSFENMQVFAKTHGFSFPYLIDSEQTVARAYRAVCTPDFFGFDKDLRLQYRGRLDASKTNLVANAEPELLHAMQRVARGHGGPAEQFSSMGCSIKWRGNPPSF